MDRLREMIERLIAGGHLGPSEQHALEDALVEAESAEHDLIVSHELPGTAIDLGVWVSGMGANHHFYWVSDDINGPYIIDIQTEHGGIAIKYIHGFRSDIC